MLLDGFRRDMYNLRDLFAVVNYRECDIGRGSRFSRSDEQDPASIVLPLCHFISSTICEKQRQTKIRTVAAVCREGH
ncbi:unnamed protein product [Ceratitis capitata]|uniref:(Mediterranean fruit fly) hypothetical protein n=1 Tax=Ceratitis capitata TaxID=7213 RepID=A0A811UR53_CERCA|nr:unnamed protein product [Ceratitis capitata]